jgi:hypothetical protein
MSTTKTYTDLSTDGGSGVKVVNCSALLPNHMQCWRAGDVLVSVVNEDQTLNSNYQLCWRHAVIDQTAYEKLQAAQAELIEAQAEITAETPATPTKSIATPK